MADDVKTDQFVLIKIEGMHCHKCQGAIQKALQKLPGVREAEVDFPSALASVLFDPNTVTVRELMESVNASGYHAAGFTRGQADHAPHHP